MSADESEHVETLESALRMEGPSPHSRGVLSSANAGESKQEIVRWSAAESRVPMEDHAMFFTQKDFFKFSTVTSTLIHPEPFGRMLESIKTYLAAEKDVLGASSRPDASATTAAPPPTTTLPPFLPPLAFDAVKTLLTPTPEELAVAVPFTPSHSSTLSLQDQQKFAWLSSKLSALSVAPAPSTAPSALSPAENQELHRLLPLVRRERETFHLELQQFVAFHYSSRYRMLSLPVYEQVQKYVAQRKSRMLALYPRLVSARQRFASISTALVPSDKLPVHVLTVLQTGSPPSVVFPSGSTLLDRAQQYYSVQDLEPAPGPAAESVHSGGWRRKGAPTVSQDPNVRKIISEHPIDAAISAGALCFLANNDHGDFAQDWDIPMFCEAAQQPGEAASSKKVLLFDKPLVRKWSTPRDQNELFFKWAFRSLVLQNEEGSGPSDAFSYDIWKFGTLNVLVRSRNYGVHTSPTGKTPMYVASKLEYLLHVGFEEFSTEQAARLWTATFLRPNALLCLGIVDAVSGAVVDIHSRSGASVVQQQTTPFNAALALKLFSKMVEEGREEDLGFRLVRYHSSQKLIEFAREALDAPQPQQLRGLAAVVDLGKEYEAAGSTGLYLLPYTPVVLKSPVSIVPYLYAPRSEAEAGQGSGGARAVAAAAAHESAGSSSASESQAARKKQSHKSKGKAKAKGKTKAKAKAKAAPGSPKRNTSARGAGMTGGSGGSGLEATEERNPTAKAKAKSKSSRSPRKQAALPGPQPVSDLMVVAEAVGSTASLSEKRRSQGAESEGGASKRVRT